MADNTAKRVLELAANELGTVGGEKYIKYFNQIEGTTVPYSSAWCASFVTYIMRSAGVPTDSVPNYKSCTVGSAWFAARGRFKTPASGYTPQPGDIIMFEWNPENNGTAYDDGDDHTGIVERVALGRVYTIEGNSDNKCKRNNYSLNSKYISGYCMPLYNINTSMEDEEMTYEQWKEFQTKYETEKAAAKVSDWAQNAVDYCTAHRIMTGDSNGNFKPRANITRQEVAQIFANFGTRYKTVNDVPDWGRETVQRMIDLGVLTGTGTDENGNTNIAISEIELRVLCWLERYANK